MPRRIDVAWAVALATGAAGAILFPRPISLADPPACAGLLEVAGIVASRTVRDVPLGEMLFWANRLIVAVALVMLVRLGQRAGDLAGTLAAAATAGAVILSAPFDSVLAPTNAAAFAAACIALLGSDRGLTPIGLALLSAIAPPMLVPCVILAIVHARMTPVGGRIRFVRLALAVVAIAAGPILVAIAAPALPTIGASLTAFECRQPPFTFSWGVAIDSVRAGLGPISQFAIALAALGAFALRSAWRPPSARWIVIFGVLSVIATALGAPDPARALAPAVVMLWLLVAAGLREVVLAIAPRGPRWIAAALVLASLPWLQLAARPDRSTADADLVRGHDQLTWSRFLQVLSAIPSGGGLVVEDAVVSMLATDAGRRRAQTGRPVVLVPPGRDQIARSLPRIAIFALPRRQSSLRHLGFQLIDLSPRATGVAEVRTGAPCQSADNAWRDAAALTSVAGFAVVADDDVARGPVSLLIGSDDALSPERAWPRRAERGFQSMDGTRDAPTGHVISASRYVTRLDIWRVPGGPLVLPVTLEAAPSAAIVRRREDAAPGRIWICPSLPYEVKSLFEQ